MKNKLKTKKSLKKYVKEEKDRYEFAHFPFLPKNPEELAQMEKELDDKLEEEEEWHMK